MEKQLVDIDALRIIKTDNKLIANQQHEHDSNNGKHRQRRQTPATTCNIGNGNLQLRNCRCQWMLQIRKGATSVANGGKESERAEKS